MVFRAVVDTADFPEALRFTAPCIWVGPNCHLVHYPLKGGDKFNIAVTFHSDQPEEWGSMDGDPAEVQRYFRSTCEQVQQLLRIPKAWKRYSTADRDPIEQWTFGRATLLGDAAHPMVQYLAQGACMRCPISSVARNACLHAVGRSQSRPKIAITLSPMNWLGTPPLSRTAAPTVAK